MCGIAGCVYPGGYIGADIIDGMISRMAHRGPDGTGVWLSKDATVGLGHKRLSIIDLSSGASQPMQSSRTGLVMVFNGEIYNHRELRRELEKAGIQFRTDHSDTETLLEAIGQWGIDGALRRLIGMFAFAVFNPAERKVYLVRDRIGIKPLYLCNASGKWLFASEAKALFSNPEVKRELNVEAFSQYLSFRFVPAPRSLFKGVEKIGAGEVVCISLEAASITKWKYWKPLETPILDSMTNSEAVDTLEDLLESSVRYRLEADVPVGIFLSGGLDSSLLLKMACKAGDKPLHSYTIRYPGFEMYDEAEDASIVAESCGSVHHEVIASGSDFAELMGQVAYYQDEPIAAPVCLPVFLLSRAARESGVPVVFAGEGADELFVGYESWLRLRDIERLNQRIPDFPGRKLRCLLRDIGGAVLPSAARAWDILDRLSKGQPVFWGGAMDFGQRDRENLLGAAVSRHSLKDDFDEVISPVLDEFLRARPANDITGWMTYLDLRYRLPELMLPRLDKMGMAHSIEGRVPFLDHRIAEFALTLPMEFHEAVGRVGKRLLKEVAVRHLPTESVYRRKKGFRAPVAEWKTSVGGGMYVEALKKFSERTELFNIRAVDVILARRNNRLYFNLINFMLWYVTFIDNPIEDCLPESAYVDNMVHLARS